MKSIKNIIYAHHIIIQLSLISTAKLTDTHEAISDQIRSFPSEDFSSFVFFVISVVTPLFCSQTPDRAIPARQHGRI